MWEVGRWERKAPLELVQFNKMVGSKLCHRELQDPCSRGWVRSWVLTLQCQLHHFSPASKNLGQVLQQRVNPNAVAYSFQKGLFLCLYFHSEGTFFKFSLYFPRISVAFSCFYVLYLGACTKLFVFFFYLAQKIPNWLPLALSTSLAKDKLMHLLNATPF